VGSVQRLATVVIVGLVALSTILFLYLGDEDNRITAKEEEHLENTISRARENYISLCLQCHGPAGEGYTEPGAAGTGRIGAPLGGVNESLNQEGVNSRGTPWPGGVGDRAEIIHDTIYNGLQNPDGTYRMPAFGGESGSLTDEQINELVVFVQNADWNEVFNEAVETAGGYPTPPPAASPEEEAEPAPSDVGEGEAGEAGAYVVESHDIFFTPTELEIPADTTVTISLPNLGAAPHNFSIDELGISVDLAPGETGEVQINAPAGEYQFYCNVPGHLEAGMVGTLIVTEGASPPAASPPSIEEEPAAEEPEADAANAEEAPAEAEAVTIASHDIFFEPAEVTIPANTDVTVSLPNEGAAPHNFSIDELEISVDQAPGETQETVINAPPGEYEFYCNVPGHREAGMVGTLIVE
jgi:plastocyanin/mono/diheme cytochrome c family protein